MAGYWRNLEETKAAFIDGALRTGDVGYLDKDGDLFLVDRIKDIIICNGFKIYPRMIEEALLQHPAVAEAVAIGVAGRRARPSAESFRHAAARRRSDAGYAPGLPQSRIYRGSKCRV